MLFNVIIYLYTSIKTSVSRFYNMNDIGFYPIKHVVSLFICDFVFSN